MFGENSQSKIFTGLKQFWSRSFSPVGWAATASSRTLWTERGCNHQLGSVVPSMKYFTSPQLAAQPLKTFTFLPVFQTINIMPACKLPSICIFISDINTDYWLFFKYSALTNACSQEADQEEISAFCIYYMKCVSLSETGSCCWTPKHSHVSCFKEFSLLITSGYLCILSFCVWYQITFSAIMLFIYGPSDSRLSCECLFMLLHARMISKPSLELKMQIKLWDIDMNVQCWFWLLLLLPDLQADCLHVAWSYSETIVKPLWKEAPLSTQGKYGTMRNYLKAWSNAGIVQFPKPLESLNLLNTVYFVPLSQCFQPFSWGRPVLHVTEVALLQEELLIKLSRSLITLSTD